MKISNTPNKIWFYNHIFSTCVYLSTCMQIIHMYTNAWLTKTASQKVSSYLCEHIYFYGYRYYLYRYRYLKKRTFLLQIKYSHILLGLQGHNAFFYPLFSLVSLETCYVKARLIDELVLVKKKKKEKNTLDTGCERQKRMKPNVKKELDSFKSKPERKKTRHYHLPFQDSNIKYVIIWRQKILKHTHTHTYIYTYMHIK